MKIKQHKTSYFTFSSILFMAISPSFVVAQTFSLEQSSFSGVITEIISVLDLLRPLLFGAAFIIFFWGLSKFILHSDSKEGVETGKKYMLWGVIALFVLVTFPAIIGFITSNLELGTPTQSGVLLPTGN